MTVGAHSKEPLEMITQLYSHIKLLSLFKGTVILKMKIQIYLTSYQWEVRSGEVL